MDKLTKEFIHKIFLHQPTVSGLVKGEKAYKNFIEYATHNDNFSVSDDGDISWGHWRLEVSPFHKEVHWLRLIVERRNIKCVLSTILPRS